ncbi:hypothetical protein EV363DRAFT_1297751 [Boletus edulis]|nr:hypothetical protein EV363DRAFT_1297751 [Boletus edulis]
MQPIMQPRMPTSMDSSDSQLPGHTIFSSPQPPATVVTTPLTSNPSVSSPPHDDSSDSALPRPLKRTHLQFSLPSEEMAPQAVWLPHKKVKMVHTSYHRCSLQEIKVMRTIATDECKEAASWICKGDLQIGELRHILHSNGSAIGESGITLFGSEQNKPEDVIGYIFVGDRITLMYSMVVGHVMVVTCLIILPEQSMHLVNPIVPSNEHNYSRIIQPTCQEASDDAVARFKVLPPKYDNLEGQREMCQLRQMLKTPRNPYPVPCCGHIEVGNAVEGPHIGKICIMYAEQHIRVIQEMFEACKIIEGFDHRIRAAPKAITSCPQVKAY